MTTSFNMNERRINLAIVKTLQDQVNRSEREATAGVLLGYQSKDTLHILGCAQCQEVSADNVIADFRSVSSYVPGGVDACGVFFTIDQAAVPLIVEKVCQRILPTNVLEELGTDSIVVCVFPKNESSQTSLYWYADQKLTPAKRVQFSDELPSGDLIFRLTASLPLTFCYSKDKDELESSLAAEISELKSKLMSNCSILQVENSDVLLHQIDGCLTKSLPTDALCHELVSYLSIENEGIDRKHPKRKPQVIELYLMQQLSGDHALEGTLNCSPIINCDLEEAISVQMQVPLDVIALVAKDSHMYSIPSLLLDSAVSQLDQVQQCLLESYENLHKPENRRRFAVRQFEPFFDPILTTKLLIPKVESHLLREMGETFYQPEVYHFRPSALKHMVTVVLPAGKKENDLENVRRQIHEKFHIAPDRPVFKKVQAVSFSGQKTTSAYLENPHLGLGSSGVKGGTVAVVEGTYSYHHYMQDRFDDNKWGCAYRSLQTLVSWFRYQGYTDVAIPTHKQVQQILVDLGDKEASFVGSRKWIGSTEVSYVLDHLLGVASKIMFVSTGAELGSKGRELATHFHTQGTPIMIGGGVLAHTIIGVDFNESSGDLKFLILDPHYTGAEDLKVIQDKGWCGWKGPDFWDQNSYYNLCMPQRPEAV